MGGEILNQREGIFLPNHACALPSFPHPFVALTLTSGQR